MILNNNSFTVQTTGEFKEYKTSIDSKNIEHIITLLSSNLYSNPEKSFLREAVSNAWDSHVEANTIDIPIIIKIDNDDKSVTIRDFGTGISKERFETIYCNIGSSTKRESNDYIGSFGIGRFAALSCSNTVFITSYYNGTMYSYIMIKDVNKININLINTCNTTEKNGVKIEIKNLKSLYNYREAIKDLVFFPNIYVEDSYPTYNINTYKIKQGKHYAVTSIYMPNKILLGNVLYPLKISNLNLSDFSIDLKLFLNSINDTGIVLKFDIGDLDITPNREEIIYTERSKQAIINKISEACTELESTINHLVTNKKDSFITNDVFNFYQYNTKKLTLDIFNNTIVPYTKSYICYHSIYDRSFSLHCTHGKHDIEYLDFPEDSLLLYRILFNYTFCGFKRNKTQGIFSTKTCNYKQSISNVVTIKGTTVYSKLIQEYIKHKYKEDCVIAIFASFEDFYNYYKKFYYDYTNTISFTSTGESEKKEMKLKKFFDIFIEELYYNYLSNIKIIDIDSEDFLAFKKKYASTKTKYPSQIILKDLNYFNETKSFDSLEECVKYIKEIKSPVILQAYYDNTNYRSLLNNIIPIRFFKANKEVIRALKKENLKNIITLKEFVTKNKEIKILYLLDTLFQNNTQMTLTLYSDIFRRFLTTLPNIEVGDFDKYIDKYLNIKLNQSDYKLFIDLKIKFNIKEDDSLKNFGNNIINKFTTYLYYYDIICKNINILQIGYTRHSFIYKLVNYLIIKNKCYRINQKSYLDYSTNDLIKIL